MKHQPEYSNDISFNNGELQSSIQENIVLNQI